MEDAITSFFAPVILQAENVRLLTVLFPVLFWNGYLK
jgi:hypothetical protein